MSLPVEVPLQPRPCYLTLPIVSSRIRDRFKVFIDEDSSSKYQAFKDNNAQMVKDLQGQGKNLPIFGFQWHSFSQSASIHESRVPKGEIFNKDRHTKEVCKVAKQSHKQYWTYQLAFKNQTIDMFMHRSSPIADFNYNGKRYRWVYFGDRHWYTAQQEFSYSLFELNEKQASLADKASFGAVNQNNPLLGSSVSALLFGSTKKRMNRGADEFVSRTKLGQLTHNQWKTSLSQVVSSVFVIGADSPLNSITDVNFDLKIFLIMCLILQFEEEEKEEKRKEAQRRRRR